jgi:hypothetical protein
MGHSSLGSWRELSPALAVLANAAVLLWLLSMSRNARR